jgi:hypothetical protein
MLRNLANNFVFWFSAYAGYTGWPLYYCIPLAGAIGTAGHFMASRLDLVETAAGGTIGYLRRALIMTCIFAAVFYGAGFGVKWLLR